MRKGISMEEKWYKNKEIVFCVLLASLFFLLSFLLMLHHEPWRDETRPWIYARGDYPMLDYIMTREFYGATHPMDITGIYPSLLYHLGLSYISYSITNILVMLASVILFLRYAPVSKFQKALFVFGYYIFYEYNIIARSWSFSILFLFCIAVMYKDRFKKPIMYNMLLFLLALTHIYVFILAAILAALYYFELFFPKVGINAHSTMDTPSFTKKQILCLSLLIIGFSYIFYPNLNPKNVPEQFTEWNTEISIKHLGTIPTAVIDAYLPIPKLQIEFWQTRGFSRALYGIPIFLATMLFFVNRIKPFLLYVALCSSLFALFFFRAIAAFRHAGLLFIIFFFCLWIAKEYKENERWKITVSPKVLSSILIFLLLIQVIAAGIAFYYDWNYEFSSAERAASFLKENGFLNNTTFIASYPSVEMVSILLRTPEYPKFYFMEYGEFRSFMVTDKKTYAFNDLPHPLTEFTEIIEKETSNKGYLIVLLILDRKIDASEEGAAQYELLAAFEESIITDKIFIYKKV